MNNTRPGTQGIAGIDWLFAIVGGMLGLLIGGFVALILMSYKGIASFIQYGIKGKDVNQEVETLASPSREKDVSGSKSRPQEEKDLDKVFSLNQEKQYSNAFSRRIPLKGAYATIWFYPHQKIARRSITLTSQVLKKRFGRRLNLPEMAVEIPKGITELVNQTTQEAEAMIEINKVRVIKPPKERAASPPVITAPVTVPKVIESTKPSEPSLKAPRPRRKQVTYQGSLIKYGQETRGEGPESYRCFCLHIYDEELGSTHQVWGTDLERAIKEAGVGSGDRIEVAQVGTIPTASGSNKKVFAIQKLMQQTA